MVSHFGSGERMMRSDVRALLRPLVRTVGLLVAVALGVVACLLVLLVMVRGSYAETLPPLAGVAKELVDLHPDVIVAITTPATAAVKYRLCARDAPCERAR